MIQYIGAFLALASAIMAARQRATEQKQIEAQQKEQQKIMKQVMDYQSGAPQRMALAAQTAGASHVKRIQDQAMSSRLPRNVQLQAVNEAQRGTLQQMYQAMLQLPDEKLQQLQMAAQMNQNMPMIPEDPTWSNLMGTGLQLATSQMGAGQGSQAALQSTNPGTIDVGGGQSSIQGIQKSFTPQVAPLQTVGSQFNYDPYPNRGFNLSGKYNMYRNYFGQMPTLKLGGR